MSPLGSPGSSTSSTKVLPCSGMLEPCTTTGMQARKGGLVAHFGHLKQQHGARAPCCVGEVVVGAE